MPRRIRLSLLCLIVVGVAFEPAEAQFRFRGQRRSFPPQRVQVGSDDDSPDSDGESASNKPPTVEELLRQLDELEARSSAPISRERGLAMILEDAHIASTNYYDPQGIRYLSVQLVLINLTDQAISIPSNQIVLEADGKQHTLAEAKERLARELVQVGNDVRQFSPPPETLEVPARDTASVWLTYPIDSAAAVPPMTLTIDWDKGAEKLDINAYERGVLGLRAERLGPRNCAALLTVTGELNTVNSATLADELDALTAAGVVRAVIAWGDAAPRPDDQVLGWLVTGFSQDGGLQYSQLPQIPAAMTELHLVQPPDHETNPFETYSQTVPMHRSTDVAVLAALQTAFEVVSRDDLRTELAHGHRLSKAAALAHAGARLGRRELPLILSACDNGDTFVQMQALAALGQFSDQAAIDRLLAAAASPDEVTMQAAVASLAGSRFPQAHAALRDFLSGLDAPRTVAIVKVLARYPRAEWMDRIVAYYASPDPALKLASLRALVKLGHADIVDLLASALASDNPDLRTEAYTQLSVRTDPRSEQLASDYALKLIAESPPDETTLTLLTRTRDRRAIPALMKHLDEVSHSRETLVRLLLQIGDASVVPDLLSRYPAFTPAEKGELLEALLAMHAPEARALALEVLTSGESELMDVAARILTSEPDRETVPRLVAALQQASSIEAWSAICNALARVGDNESREALLVARRHDDRQKRDFAISALSQIKSASPAFQYSYQAAQVLDESAQLNAEQLKDSRRKAEKLLDLAISFDPEYAEAYARRGHLFLLQQRLTEAQKDFDQAAKLDPFDSLAITGHAIVMVMQGELEKGIQQIRESADQFPGDAGFEYNSACVYGRAVESLQKSTRPDAEQLRSEYQAAGLRHLKNSMLLGFSSIDIIKNDPDLAVFHDVPEFRELLEDPPSPGDEEVEPAPLELRGEI
jgi:HEAT repeat protein